MEKNCKNCKHDKCCFLALRCIPYDYAHFEAAIHNLKNKQHGRPENKG